MRNSQQYLHEPNKENVKGWYLTLMETLYIK